MPKTIGNQVITGNLLVGGRSEPDVFNLPDWMTGESYILNDMALENGIIYVCIAPHISSASFSADISNWSFVSDVTDVAIIDGSNLLVTVLGQTVPAGETFKVAYPERELYLVAKNTSASSVIISSTDFTHLVNVMTGINNMEFVGVELFPIDSLAVVTLTPTLFSGLFTHSLLTTDFRNNQQINLDLSAIGAATTTSIKITNPMGTTSLNSEFLYEEITRANIIGTPFLTLQITDEGTGTKTVQFAIATDGFPGHIQNMRFQNGSTNELTLGVPVATGDVFEFTWNGLTEVITVVQTIGAPLAPSVPATPIWNGNDSSYAPGEIRFYTPPGDTATPSVISISNHYEKSFDLQVINTLSPSSNPFGVGGELDAGDVSIISTFTLGTGTEGNTVNWSPTTSGVLQVYPGRVRFYENINVDLTNYTGTLPLTITLEQGALNSDDGHPELRRASDQSPTFTINDVAGFFASKPVEISLGSDAGTRPSFSTGGLVRTMDVDNGSWEIDLAISGSSASWDFKQTSPAVTLFTQPGLNPNSYPVFIGPQSLVSGTNYFWENANRGLWFEVAANSSFTEVGSNNTNVGDNWFGETSGRLDSGDITILNRGEIETTTTTFQFNSTADLGFSIGQGDYRLFRTILWDTDVLSATRTITLRLEDFANTTLLHEEEHYASLFTPTITVKHVGTQVGVDLVFATGFAGTEPAWQDASTNKTIMSGIGSEWEITFNGTAATPSWNIIQTV